MTAMYKIFISSPANRGIGTKNRPYKSNSILRFPFIYNKREYILMILNYCGTQTGEKFEILPELCKK